MQSGPKDERGRSSRLALYVEDIVILLALIPLFILAVFFRRTWWGQAGLAVVLIVMGVVFFFRVRRVHRLSRDVTATFSAGGKEKQRCSGGKRWC